MNKLSEETIEYIIHEALEDAQNLINSDKSDPFIAGQRLAYYKVLYAMQTQLKINDADLKRFGLDISLNKFI